MRLARSAPPNDDQPGGSRRPRGRAVASLLAVALGLSVALPLPGAATTTWSLNLFAPGAFLYQDPYLSSCTAAAAMMMLNTIDIRETGGPGFTWTVNRTRNDPADARDLLSVLAWARAHDTLASGTRGSDPHGWRNALNWFGWGTGTEAANRVYQDRAYATFSGAVKAAVRAIARYRMPVGILGRAGGHAQVMHGYTVIGGDPAVSNDFTVVSVYVSDPLRSAELVNRRVSLESLRSGPLRVRFRRYREVDSPRDDPYTGGWMRSSVLPTVAPSEWYGRWVIILPVRAGVSTPPPTPTPTPTPSPTPTPTATPPPTPSPSPSPTPTPSPVPTSTATPSPPEAPIAPPTPTPEGQTATPSPSSSSIREPAPYPSPTPAAPPEDPAPEPPAT